MSPRRPAAGAPLRVSRMIVPLALSLPLVFQAPPPSQAPVATGDVAPSSRPAPKQRATFFEKSEVPLAAEVYCKIDGFPVSRAEFGDWLQRYRGDPLIESYVTGTWIRKDAKAAGVEVGPEDLDAILNQRIEERTVQAYRGNRDYFIQQEITQFGKTLEQWKAEQARDVETEVLVRKTMKKKRLTTDADVEKEFKRLYGASGREIWLRAVLLEIDMPTLQTHKPAPEVQAIAEQAIQKAYRKGVDVVKRLQSGAIDFPSAALAKSMAPLCSRFTTSTPL